MEAQAAAGSQHRPLCFFLAPNAPLPDHRRWAHLKQVVVGHPPGYSDPALSGTLITKEEQPP